MADTHLIRVLRAEMRQRGISQVGLALAAGLNKDAVRNVFRGSSRMPRMETIRALADYLGVTADYLLGREKPRTGAVNQEGGDGLPTIPDKKPGPDEWEEIRRFWAVASPDAKRALVYLVRTMSRSEGVVDQPKGNSEGGKLKGS